MLDRAGIDGIIGAMGAENRIGGQADASGRRDQSGAEIAEIVGIGVQRQDRLGAQIIRLFQLRGLALVDVQQADDRRNRRRG